MRCSLRCVVDGVRSMMPMARAVDRRRVALFMQRQGA
jgi:hypothetical protein